MDEFLHRRDMRGLWTSARQRVVVLTFTDAHEADEWDRYGGHVVVVGPYVYEVEATPWPE